MLPVRCYTCGKPLFINYDTYKELCNVHKSAGDVLDLMGMKRTCCRRMYLSYVDVYEDQMKYPDMEISD